MNPGEGRITERRWRGARIRPSVVPASGSSAHSSLLGVSARSGRLIPDPAGLIRASSKQKVVSQSLLSRGTGVDTPPAQRGAPY